MMDDDQYEKMMFTRILNSGERQESRELDTGFFEGPVSNLIERLSEFPEECWIEEDEVWGDYGGSTFYIWWKRPVTEAEARREAASLRKDRERVRKREEENKERRRKNYELLKEEFGDE